MTGLRWIEQSFATPAENLACDEALLDGLEAGTCGPTLRFWESAVPFVVVGFANRIAAEVNEAECARLGIPILRRCSGGGTVVQGPGCLNYNLVLPITEETATITATNRFVMERQRDALGGLLGRAVRIEGHTDLALDGRKFSGNAQRRRQNALVFHGCFLLDFDLPLIARLLRFPTRQPDYRADRRHEDFVMNLRLPAAEVRQALRQAWGAEGTLPPISAQTIEPLLTARYRDPAWHAKF